MNNRAALISALEWYVDAGVTIITDEKPNDRFSKEVDVQPIQTEKPAPQMAKPAPSAPVASDILESARAAAEQCQTLDDLRAAILAFDAHPLKKLATNMVFGSGHPSADLMIIGDPPATDEDRSGDAFCGTHGQLLDKMFAAIGLARNGQTETNSFYAAHIINWRPPGNRTPTEEEVAISLPFVERHIELVSPKFLILMGGTAGKSILKTAESMSRIRGQWHEYGGNAIPTLTTYTPEFLMSNPLQKRKVWTDILSLKDKMSAD